LRESQGKDEAYIPCSIFTVISRLRSDAKLTDLPPPRKAGQRGRPRKYGLNRIDLKKRAEHPQGWTSTSYVCRGGAVLRFKTFLATTSIADAPNPERNWRVRRNERELAWKSPGCRDKIVGRNGRVLVEKDVLGNHF
jgi:hypothetical protein